MRSFALAVFLVAIVTLFWTHSRAGIFASLFGAVMVITAILHRVAPRRMLMPLLFAVLSVPVAVGVASSIGRGLSLDGLAVALTADTSTALASVQGREPGTGDAYLSDVSHVLLQRVGIDMVLHDASTALVGVGRYEYLSAIFDPHSRYYLSWVLESGIGGPHSAYVSVAVAAGLPGLALYCAVLMISVGRGVRALFRNRRLAGDTLILQAVASGVVGLATIGLVDTNPILFPEAAFLFSFLGALSGLGDASRRSVISTSRS